MELIEKIKQTINKLDVLLKQANFFYPYITFLTIKTK